jgi:hypothetical protein
MRWMAVVLMVGCTPATTDQVVIEASADERDRVAAWLGTIGDDRLTAVVGGADIPRGAVHLVLGEESFDAPGSFRLTRTEDDEGAVVGADLLGRLYGVSEVLETLGWRFHHPQRSWLPDGDRQHKPIPASTRPRPHVPGSPVAPLAPLPGPPRAAPNAPVRSLSASCKPPEGPESAPTRPPRHRDTHHPMAAALLQPNLALSP